jgi:hypothetical protein
VCICVVGGSGGSSKVKGSFLRMSSDGVSVKLTNPNDTPGEGVPPPVRKFIYDKVLDALDAEFSNVAAASLQDYIFGALEGQHTCAIVYGKVFICLVLVLCCLWRC